MTTPTRPLIVGYEPDRRPLVALAESAGVAIDVSEPHEVAAWSHAPLILVCLGGQEPELVEMLRHSEGTKILVSRGSVTPHHFDEADALGVDRVVTLPRAWQHLVEQLQATVKPQDDPAVAGMVIAGRRVDAYTNLREHLGCQEHQTGNSVGYVVRQTVDKQGQVMRRDEPGRPSCGFDVFAVASVPGWGNYDKARDRMFEVRTGEGNAWAVVDTLYRCGHRAMG